MKTVQELATDTRRINAANGWGLTWKMDDLPGNIALIHSEITEAWQESHPEKMARELGDVIVRALDLSELIQPGELTRFDPAGLQFVPSMHPAGKPLSWSLMQLHTLTSEVLESFRKVKDPAVMKGAVLDGLATVIAFTWQLMLLTYSGAHPAEVVEGILHANAQREYRHGGRRT